MVCGAVKVTNGNQLKLQGFSQLDLASAYKPVEVAFEGRHKTAFTYNFGLLE